MAKLEPLPERSAPRLFDKNSEIALNKAPVLSAAGNPSMMNIRSLNPRDTVAVAGMGNELLGQDQLVYFDYNLHSLKKGLSSALLDVALLMANVSQLKSVYLWGHQHPFYTLLMVLLISSIILQIVSGLIMIFLGRININVPDNVQHRQAEVLATCFLASIFLLTLINIFISSLGISEGYPTNMGKDSCPTKVCFVNETKC